MSVVVQRFGPEDPRWMSELSDVVHDVYHLPGFGDAIARHEGGHAELWVASEVGTAKKLVMPLVVRTVDPAVPGDANTPLGVDGSSPYNYGGPLISASARNDGVNRLWTSLLDELRKHAFITLFLRTNPYLPFPFERIVEHPVLVSHGRTVSVPLEASTDELWRGVRKTTKPKVNGFHRDGFP